MAATVFLSESNGVVEAVTDNIANINFGSFDGPNMVAAQHAIVAGNVSTTKWLRIKLQNLGGSTSISGTQVWKSSGAYVTGEYLGSNYNAGGLGGGSPQITTYGTGQVAFGSPVIATPYTGNGAALFNFTGGDNYSTAPIALGGGIAWTLPGGLLNAAPSYSYYGAFGLGTTGATPIGPVNTKVITISYTET